MRHPSIRSVFGVLALLLAGFGGAPPLSGAEPEPAIRVDLPVTLKTPRVVFNLDLPVFSGDLPTGFRHMAMLAKRFKAVNPDGEIIGILHGEMAYLALNDHAYNAFRQVTTGNPCQGALADLLKQGVRIESCANSMKARHWGNADLLPGIKVIGGALERLIQLVQDGYVQIEH